MSDYKRLVPLERHWRAGVSLFVPMAVAVAPKVSTLGVSLCAFRHLTGLPCPLCGGTRLCAALAQGDVASAWQFNAGLAVVFAVAALHSGLLLSESITGRALGTPRALVLAWQLAGCFLLLSWAWRLMNPTSGLF